jgi:cytidine deaminase
LVEPSNSPTWRRLIQVAWRAQRRARILGDTKVGAAVLCPNGQTFVGCNVEHKFRSHDIHAEVNAIGSMVAGGQKKIRAILIVAERRRFTPCGACMDWIFEFGGERCLVGFQRKLGGTIQVYRAGNLMPYYPV